MIRKTIIPVSRPRPPGDVLWVERTNIFHKRAAIREEIMRHKWIESEKVGHDIGWERASLDWMIHHSKNANLQ